MPHVSKKKLGKETLEKIFHRLVILLGRAQSKNKLASTGGVMPPKVGGKYWRKKGFRPMLGR